MTETPRRIVVCDEPRRNADLRPGPSQLPSEKFERMAKRYGDALGLPYVAVAISLEQCELTDFVLYHGFWDAFVAATPDWSMDQRQLRAHRTGHLMAFRSREYAAELDEWGLAFALPWEDLHGTLPGGAAELYGRREISEATGLKLWNGMFRAQHYITTMALPGMSQEEMVARYLRTYWDRLGY